MRGKAAEFVKFAFRQVAMCVDEKPISSKWDENVDFLVHGVKVGQLAMVCVSSAGYPGARAVRLMKQQLGDLFPKLPPKWMETAVDS